jgi:5-methylcytosine-specific restriction enzyme A
MHVPWPQRHWREWYQSERWRRRRRYQLQLEPLCALCLHQHNGRVTPACIADHIEPHRGDWNKFLTAPLQSLCTDCHAQKTVSDRGDQPVVTIGVDGWPVERIEPFE